MMLALVLALQAAAQAPAPNPGAGPLAAIGRQKLPVRGCAAYLWTLEGNRQLVAMASADPAQIRLAIDGKVADYARATQSDSIGFGFGGVTQYRRDDVTATLDMAIATRADITAGATVTAATLRIDRVGYDTIVVPVGGLIGCV